MDAIKYIVIHCSDTPNGRPHDAADIRRWHVHGNGWEDIGYHYVIQLTGEVERGRNEDVQGAHVRGHNHESIGICLIGRDEYTDAQMRSLEGLVIAHKSNHPRADVVAHYDLDTKGKTCPNMNILAWWSDVKKRGTSL